MLFRRFFGARFGGGAAVFFLLWILPANAIRAETGNVTVTDNYEVAIGAGVQSFDYQERLPSPLKSTEKGEIRCFDLVAKYWLRPFNDDYFHPSKGTTAIRARVDYGSASLKYDGTLQDGTPYTFKHDNVFKTFEGGLEGDLLETTEWSFRAAAALGFHSWERGASSDSKTYEEDYEWNFLRFGAAKAFALGSDFSVAPELDLYFPFLGALNVKLSKLSADGVTFSDVKLGLDVQPYFAVQFPLSYAITSALVGALTPRYEQLTIVKSEQVVVPVTIDGQRYGLGIGEPTSTTKNISVDLSASFRF